MTTVHAPAASGQGKRSRRKPDRHICWLARLAAGKGILQVRLKHSDTREEVDRYFIAPLPAADFGGPAFLLERWDEATAGKPAGISDTYHVHLPGEGEPGSCDCKGHTRYGHCKHLAGLVKLSVDGRL
jgi:hypothetical protein